MLGVFFAFFLFGGLVAQGETGTDYLSAGPHKLCQVMGGDYKGTVYSGGTGREARHTGATVPYCTAGPSTLVEGLLKEKGVIE